jgi:hypothetical protein
MRYITVATLEDNEQLCLLEDSTGVAMQAGKKHARDILILKTEFIQAEFYLLFHQNNNHDRKLKSQANSSTSSV